MEVHFIGQETTANKCSLLNLLLKMSWFSRQLNNLTLDFNTVFCKIKQNATLKKKNLNLQLWEKILPWKCITFLIQKLV